VPSELLMIHVLRHPAEAVGVETIDFSRLGLGFVEAGTTEHFVVAYHLLLGQRGEQLARGILSMCEADFVQVRTWFGGVLPNDLPFRCLIMPGSFGAFHATCADTQLHLAAFDGDNAELVEMVNMAEVVEVFSAAQKLGWNCGASNGEGLSRVLSTQLHPTQPDGFATAADWLNSRRPNFVDRSDPTDQNPISIGCAVLFLNYLRYQLGYDWQGILSGGRPTLAETYYVLTGGKTNAWRDFSGLLDAHFPRGTRANVTTDNVFPL
jgi:hypothetical protein